MDTVRFDDLTQRLASRTSRRTAFSAALSGLTLGGAHLLTGHATQAQTPAASSQPGDQPVFMFVQTAVSGRGEVNPSAGTPVLGESPDPGGGASFVLTLEGHTGATVYFSDRPERIAGAMPTEKFLAGLGFSRANPPNAALVAEFASGSGVVVLQLTEPSYDADTGVLTYGAEGLGAYPVGQLESVTRDQVLERLPATFEAAALFIDGCPNYSNCLMEVWASFDGTPVYLGVESVGPLPGGPYIGCFNPTDGTCAPCDSTLDELAARCNATYSDPCQDSCFPGS